MESEKKGVECESAATVGSALRDLLSRQDLQPVAGATHREPVSTEPRCMFSEPRPMNKPYQSYPLDWVMYNK